MKRLITAADVEMFAQEGQSAIAIDSNTLITPQARDVAVKLDVTFEEEARLMSAYDDAAIHKPVPAYGHHEESLAGLNAESIYQALRIMQDKGLLNQEFLNALPIKFYREEQTVQGARLVYGDSLTVPFRQGIDAEANGQDINILESTGPSSLGAGFLNVRQSYECPADHLDRVFYVISGSVRVELFNEGFFARKGDSFIIPRGLDLTLKAEGYCQLFYAYA